jgi:hypothetical protein
MTLAFTDTSLRGAVRNAVVSLGGNSKWIATSDSRVNLVACDIAKIDAAEGVVITAVADDGCVAEGDYRLESGGTLKVASSRK